MKHQRRPASPDPRPNSRGLFVRKDAVSRLLGIKWLAEPSAKPANVADRMEVGAGGDEGSATMAPTRPRDLP